MAMIVLLAMWLVRGGIAAVKNSSIGLIEWKP